MLPTRPALARILLTNRESTGQYASRYERPSPTGITPTEATPLFPADHQSKCTDIEANLQDGIRATDKITRRQSMFLGFLGTMCLILLAATTLCHALDVVCYPDLPVPVAGYDIGVSKYVQGDCIDLGTELAWKRVDGEETYRWDAIKTLEIPSDEPNFVRVRSNDMKTDITAVEDEVNVRLSNGHDAIKEILGQLGSITLCFARDQSSEREVVLQGVRGLPVDTTLNAQVRIIYPYPQQEESSARPSLELYTSAGDITVNVPVHFDRLKLITGEGDVRTEGTRADEVMTAARKGDVWQKGSRVAGMAPGQVYKYAKEQITMHPLLE